MSMVRLAGLRKAGHVLKAEEIFPQSRLLVHDLRRAWLRGRHVAEPRQVLLNHNNHIYRSNTNRNISRIYIVFIRQKQNIQTEQKTSRKLAEKS